MIIEQNGFIHHVFFWLKNEINEDDRKLLIAGLNDLTLTPGIQNFHIGIPASTHRQVVENSYAVSWLVLFATKEDHDSYQEDPVHLKFIAVCSHLWSKVVVYDTLGAEY